MAQNSDGDFSKKHLDIDYDTVSDSELKGLLKKNNLKLKASGLRVWHFSLYLTT